MRREVILGLWADSFFDRHVARLGIYRNRDGVDHPCRPLLLGRRRDAHQHIFPYTSDLASGVKGETVCLNL